MDNFHERIAACRENMRQRCREHTSVEALVLTAESIVSLAHHDIRSFAIEAVWAARLMKAAQDEALTCGELNKIRHEARLALWEFDHAG